MSLGDDSLIAATADKRDGIVTRLRLLALGLTPAAVDWRLANRRLIHMYDGVYAVGHRILTPNGHRRAAVLACGPAAVLSHKSAGALWGLLTTSQTKHDVTVPGTSRKPQRGIRVHRTRSLHPDDVTTRDGIPVTSVARTIVDLAGVLRPSQLLAVIEQAERERLLNIGQIQQALDRRPNAKGSKRLRRILGGYTGVAPTRSELERRFLALVTKAGLPAPLVNTKVAGLEVDIYWPQWRLVVELDGRGYHSGPRSFETDRIRDARLQRARCRVLRVTSKRMQKQPQAVVGDIRALAALAA